MILIPDSDDDKLEDANKNPHLTEAQKEDFRKEWVYEKSVLESQGGRHAWPEPCINEAIRCVTKEHGDQCQGGMPSCNFQLVADLDCFHENAAKQKDLQEGGAFKKHQEPEDLQVAAAEVGGGTTEMATPPPEIMQHMRELRKHNPDAVVIKAVRCPLLPGGWGVEVGGGRMEIKEAVSEAEAEASSSISSRGSQLHEFCDASQLPEDEEATLPDFCDETQVTVFCDESQLPEYEEASLPDFGDETQVPDSCDGAQLDVFNETQPDV